MDGGPNQAIPATGSVTFSALASGNHTVALSGGCFQNKLLFAQTRRRLEAEGLKVLSHERVPAHDGGLALGQAAIGAARLIRLA